MRRRLVTVLICLGALAALAAWAFWYAPRSSAPTVLPPARRYEPVGVPAATTTASLVDGVANIPATSTAVLPTATRLAVPFLSQAPKQNWDLPYQEACEEASVLMVRAYLAGQDVDISPEDGDRKILGLVAWEASRYGADRMDMTAAEMAEIVKGYFPDLDAEVRPVDGADDIKRVLAQGYPVIVPADGKALPNPHFRNGGPVYHMLVITGYAEDGTWITNDPGTKFGKNLTYSERGLLDAVRDWNGGDVPHGAPRMLVLLPKNASLRGLPKRGE